MSITQGERLLGRINEAGLNDVLTLFLSARPRHLKYGSGTFVNATSSSATRIDPIPFPGTGGGIEWMVSFDVPVADIHPQTTDLPPELSLDPGQLSIRTKAELCFRCDSNRPKDPADRPPMTRPGSCFPMEVAAVAHLERSGPDVRIIVDDIEVIDIEPPELESLVECLMLQLLRSALASIELPIASLTAGALADFGVGSFTLSPQSPVMRENQASFFFA